MALCLTGSCTFLATWGPFSSSPPVDCGRSRGGTTSSAVLLSRYFSSSLASATVYGTGPPIGLECPLMERQVNVSEAVFSCVEQDSMGSVLSLFVAGRECVAPVGFLLMCLAHVDVEGSSQSFRRLVVTAFSPCYTGVVRQGGSRGLATPPLGSSCLSLLCARTAIAPIRDCQPLVLALAGLPRMLALVWETVNLLSACDYPHDDCVRCCYMESSYRGSVRPR